MWFDVSGNFSPKKASAPGEKHHAGCQRRIVAIQVPVHVPGCSSSVLWICPHHTYHRHVTTMSRFLNWIQMALQYRQVQFHFSMCSPDFFCSHNISQYLTRFFNVGLKGPQFHSPVGPPPWHTWAATRCRFAALQSLDWGTHRLAWSQWNWQWCLLQLANDIGSSWAREKCEHTSQCLAFEK